MKKLLLVLTLCAMSAFAQTPAAAPPANAPRPMPKPQEQLDAMSKLEYMTGRWSGAGWIEMGGPRMTFHGSETVTPKLDGLALLVEGDFLSGDAKSLGGGTPVHQTLGVITFDPKTKTYRFVSWLATGSAGERELTVRDGGWSWEINAPNNRIRYTFSLTPQGEWLEKGERSTDGTTWKQFFEMKLAKEL